MLFRFSLYGFLKNQRYFEPFLYLYFIDNELSFAQIGLLVSVKEISLMLLEIPSGILADLIGRRKLMIASFTTYIISFLFFSFSHTFFLFIPAMIFFGTGDACRTGTHKAMIFSWLRKNNRLHEKTKIYGYTRSWSKIGSAVSIIVGTAMVFLSGSYNWIFLSAIVPYSIGIINFLSYPDYLDGSKTGNLNFSQIRTYLQSIRQNIKNKTHFYRLMMESMFFEGTFKAVKDYVQPIIQTFALSISMVALVDNFSRTTFMVGIVYTLIYLLSSWSSRQSHKLVRRVGDEESLIYIIWLLLLVVYALMGTAIAFQLTPAIILMFIILTVVQNIFRPAHISRFETYSDAETGSAILSIESQSKSVFTAIMAPLIGWGIDLAGGYAGLTAYLIIPLVGIILSLIIISLYKKWTVKHV